MIEFQKLVGVLLPPRKSGRKFGELSLALRSLEVGEAIVVTVPEGENPLKTHGRALARARDVSKLNGAKYATRSYEGKIGVWRIS